MHKEELSGAVYFYCGDSEVEMKTNHPFMFMNYKTLTGITPLPVRSQKLFRIKQSKSAFRVPVSVQGPGVALLLP